MWSTRLQQRLTRLCDKPDLYLVIPRFISALQNTRNSAPTHKPARKIGWLVQGRPVENKPIEIGYPAPKPLHLSLWATQTNAGEIILLVCSTARSIRIRSASS